MRKPFLLVLCLFAIAIYPALSCGQALSAVYCDDPGRSFVTGAWGHGLDVRYSIGETGKPVFPEKRGDWEYE